MPGDVGFHFLAALFSVAFSLPAAKSSLAYVGLGPGLEFLPYFLALLAFVGGAFVAILQWPFSLLLRYLRKAKEAPKEEVEDSLLTVEIPGIDEEAKHDSP